MFLIFTKNIERYYTLNQYFKNNFGSRVHKVTLDAGFTCPNRDGTKGTGGCIYCNCNGSGSGLYKKGLSVTEQMKKVLPYLKKRFKTEKFIAYFQSFSNTYGNIEELKKKYEEALADRRIVGLSIGTRPDCLNKEILDLLRDYQNSGYMIWLELGLQSCHDRTLKFINRGHSYNDFLIALEKVKEAGLLLCTHIIFGLPEETDKDMMETVEKISLLPIDGVKFHCLYIVKGTSMEKLFMEKKYKPLEQDKYIDLICDSIAKLPERIVIQRLIGEPRPDEVIEPLWTCDKKAVVELLEKRLEEKNLWQGKYLSSKILPNR